MTTDSTTPTPALEQYSPAVQPIPDGRHAAPVSALPPSEALMSLTGYDEIAIAAHFGATITDLREDPMAAGRALAFVHYRRDRDTYPNDKAAHDAALALTLRQVVEFHAPEPKPDAEGNDGTGHYA